MATNDTISRREFVKHGVTAGVSSLLLGGAASRAYGSQWDEEAEFIVIGSGAGGGPVCSNLAKAGFNVLLLEAGGKKENDNYRVPAFHGNSTDDPEFAWHYFVKHYSEPAKNNRNYDSKYVTGKGVQYPRAGTLGGCTAHNAMITMYPENRDWDRIAKVTGDSSWEAEGMRRYYQRVESAQYRDANRDVQRRGFKGWLGVEQVDRTLLLRDKALFKMVVAAADEANVTRSVLARVLENENLDNLFELDPNDWEYVLNQREGLIVTPKATLRGKRNGTRELILRMQHRYAQNFKVKTHCLATRLLFEGDTNRIVGVEYLEGERLYEADPRSTDITKAMGVKRKARATKEVILAGGAFNSPQLLMLSGIGPKEELRRHGIPVKIDLSGVGKNLQDRYEVTVVSELAEPLAALKDCTFGQPGDLGMREYLKSPTSHVYGTNGVVVGVKKRSKDTKPDGDLFIFGVPGDFRGYYPGWSKDATKTDRFTWAVLKGQTANTRGEVTLKSSNPRQTPEINFKYFEEGGDSEGDDLRSVVEGLKFARQINNNGAAQKVLKRELHPGSAVQSDSEMKAFIKKEAWGHHASCTNKIGALSDPAAVVDAQFNVRQAKGLRIVDASIFPFIPGLFIVVPVYMIAEKASAQILRDYGKSLE